MGTRAYHVQFPSYCLMADHPICYLEAINAISAIKMWAMHFKTQLVHLYWDNEMEITIVQAGHGRDPFIQVCDQQLWLICASYDITLDVGHIGGELLIFSADVLSHWHMGQQFKDCVNILIRDKCVKIISVAPDAFVLSPSP